MHRLKKNMQEYNEIIYDHEKQINNKKRNDLKKKINNIKYKEVTQFNVFMILSFDIICRYIMEYFDSIRDMDAFARTCVSVYLDTYDYIDKILQCNPILLTKLHFEQENCTYNEGMYQMELCYQKKKINEEEYIKVTKLEWFGRVSTWNNRLFFPLYSIVNIKQDFICRWIQKIEPFIKLKVIPMGLIDKQHINMWKNLHYELKLFYFY